jgi:hypothetical protein
MRLAQARHAWASWRAWFLLAAGVWAIVFVAALLAIAAYYDPVNQIRYGSSLSSGVVAAGLRANSEALRRAFTAYDGALLACVISGLLALGLTWDQPKSASRWAVFATHLVLLPWAWLGLLMVPYTMVEGVDGEWLAEHSPTMIAAGLWVLYVLAMLIASGDRGWIGRGLGKLYGARLHPPRGG